ncbi:SapC family protein, partial [Arhodomonas aquaeolei]
VRTLQDLGLLRPRTLQLSHPGGERFTVNDFQAIDEEAFRALGDDDVLALHREGFLGWVFAHLMSLGAANRLFDRHIAGRDAAAPAGAASGSA